jgi:rhodanese-related sulfurtransferase
MACAISVADAREFLSRAESVVVDTRSAVEYSAFHVDGALNISEQALRTKTFLQSKPIVLAGNGKGEHELYAACGDLKRAGFKQVRVLRGGMPAWLNALSPVMGTVVPVPPMLRLTSAQLMVEAAFDENLILISPQMRTVQKLLPTATSLASSNPEAVAKATKDLLVRRGKQAKGMVSSSVVLVADATINDEYIDQLSKLLKPSPLLVYTDGADLLKQFVRGQEAMWKSYAQGPQKPKCKL